VPEGSQDKKDSYAKQERKARAVANSVMKRGGVAGQKPWKKIEIRNDATQKSCAENPMGTLVAGLADKINGGSA
jgi:hypothetical protein